MTCRCLLLYLTADPQRTLSVGQLLSASLPYADVTYDGGVTLGKMENSGGELSVATCTQQLLYEIGDPARYITPDVVCVSTAFCELSVYFVLLQVPMLQLSSCSGRLMVVYL